MAKRAHEVVEEKLTVASVARRIGVAPATLRTWDRRYGLGPSEHNDGEHRRYCPADVAKLMTMRRLIVAGVAPAEAAEQAKNFKGEYKVKKIVKEFEGKTSTSLAPNAFDLTVISVAHSNLEVDKVINSAPIIFDFTGTINSAYQL